MTESQQAPDSDPGAMPDDVVDVPTPRLPDRADAPVSETIERFMRAITAVVPVERIEELHLFSPLRQGGVETGIAIIAARALAPVEVAAPAEPVEAQLTLDGGETTATADDVARADADDVIEVEVPEAEVIAILDGAETAADAATPEPVLVTDVTPDEDVDEDVDEHVDEDVHAEVDADDSPYAPEVVHDIVEHAIEDTAEIITEVIASEQAVAAPVERHTVYTARYRLVQKGPERGKWESDVRDEADAPLITVDLVVRGVQRRAGEASETTRYTGAQVARILARVAPPPAR